MCGIAGLWSPTPPDKGSLQKMIRVLQHRGPDHQDIWLSPAAGLGLAHARLSILELSHSGDQPMTSSDGRFVLTFNGEIYNHQELRKELCKTLPNTIAWRGHSDTETLVEAIAAWGIAKTLTRLVGMYAFAVWDKQTQSLKLARDRMGEKPLVYGYAGRTFVFASELSALRTHPEFNGSLDEKALGFAMDYGYIPAPLTVYHNAHKLLPGHWLEMTREHLARRAVPRSAEYWSPARAARNGLLHPLSEHDWQPALRETILRSVQSQLIADVPVGTFLSGGVDSALVTALAHRQTESHAVTAFTLGFTDKQLDESPRAVHITQPLHIPHRVFSVTDQDAQTIVPRLPAIYDEPFADASQIPTYLISQHASQHVKVVLTGDGGDELFGGYKRYRLMIEVMSWLDNANTLGLGKALAGAYTAALALGRALPGALSTQDAVWLEKLKRCLPANSLEELYTRWQTHGLRSARTPILHPYWRGQVSALEKLKPLHKGTVLDALMLADQMFYLPNDLLVKIDRAAMAHSLETRAPLLDHRLVELAWQIPAAARLRGRQGKHPLVQLVREELPWLTWPSAKKGFSVPLGVWLRGPLRRWADSLIHRKRLLRRGWSPCGAQTLQNVWREHLAGADHAAALWNVLMTEAWLEWYGQT